MSFETALTGLNAAAADLDVVGNNIANSATTGFKQSRAEFADIFASSNLGVSRTAIGQGVRLASVTQQFGQGQFNYTGNSLDMAINGSGFFQVLDGGQPIYTRAGAFQLDRNGYVVDSSGRQMVGYQADLNTGGITGALGALRINTGDVAPRATGTDGTAMEITANLFAGEAPVTGIDPNFGTDPAATYTPAIDNADSYSFSTSTTVYDTLGHAHLQTLYFVKTAEPGQWAAYTQLDDQPIGAPTFLQFSPADGTLSGMLDATLAPTTAPSYTYPVTGADPLTIPLDFSDITQYGTPFSVTRITQNGYPAGQYSSLNVEADGRITARYTNGQSQTVGQVALFNFGSPQNLQQAGDTSWLATFASGDPLPGTPGNSGLGTLQSGSLEASNVNVTEQLVKMITAQRNYQANAKMISTQDQMSQEILNIR